MKSLLWLQSGGCGGCTMSLLGAEDPSFPDALELSGIKLLWHPALSVEQDRSLPELLSDILEGRQSLDYLCIEGAMLAGENGRFHRLAGTDKTLTEWVKLLTSKAEQVLAIGSCSSYGSIARNNPLTGAIGLQFEGSHPGGLLGRDFRSLNDMPVINIAGCPTHPEWIIETLQLMAADQFDDQQIEDLQRPKFYTDYLAHHGCPRNEYYEYKASAKSLGQNGCLMENLGCKATQARADCNIRLWNGKGSCLRGGYACIGCTSPEFDQPGHKFMQTPKVAGIPIGIPTDMPKAWFVALSSLSKAATPDRLKQNAVATKIVVEPKKEQSSQFEKK